MLDALREFMKGPGFIFALVVAILGILRLVYLHVYLIVVALYNSWKYTKNRVELIKKVLRYTLPRNFLPVVFTFASIPRILFYGILFLLPFLVIDHVSLFEKNYGVQFVAFSRPFADLLLLLLCVTIIVKLRKSLSGEKGNVGYINNFCFWLLILMVLITGYLSSTINTPALLKFMQVIHLFTGDVLIFLIPFSRIGYYLVYPFARMTSHLGFWALPDAQRRDETTPYFKSLMEKQ